jgi:hypothetical protein
VWPTCCAKRWGARGSLGEGLTGACGGDSKAGDRQTGIKASAGVSLHLKTSTPAPVTDPHRPRPAGYGNHTQNIALCGCFAERCRARGGCGVRLAVSVRPRDGVWRGPRAWSQRALGGEHAGSGTPCVTPRWETFFHRSGGQGKVRNNHFPWPPLSGMLSMQSRIGHPVARRSGVRGWG